MSIILSVLNNRLLVERSFETNSLWPFEEERLFEFHLSIAPKKIPDEIARRYNLSRDEKRCYEVEFEKLKIEDSRVENVFLSDILLGLESLSITLGSNEAIQKMSCGDYEVISTELTKLKRLITKSKRRTSYICGRYDPQRYRMYQVISESHTSDRYLLTNLFGYEKDVIEQFRDNLIESVSTRIEDNSGMICSNEKYCLINESGDIVESIYISDLEISEDKKV